MTAPAQDQQQQDQQQKQQRDQRQDQGGGAPLAWLAAWLVLRHQAEQRSIAADVVTRLAPLWKILDFHDLKNTQTPWIQAALPIVEDAYVASQWAAQRFLVDYRHAHLPAAPELPAITGAPTMPGRSGSSTGAVATQLESELRAQMAAALGGTAEPEAAATLPEVPKATTAPAEAAHAAEATTPKVIEDTPFQVIESTVSLVGTGPGEVKKQMPAPEDQAMDAGRVLSSKVAVRIAIDGGRAVVRRGVDLDHEAVGWARVLNVDPCYFCAMLASRGAVYKRDSFDRSNGSFEGEGVAKVHDGCRCGLRPVYSHSDTRDPTAEAAWQQWKDHAQGLPSKEAIRAFRRNYKAPDPPEAPRIDLHSLLAERNRLLQQGFAEDSTQVRWFDQQIATFDAILGNHGVIDPATRAARSNTAGKTAKTAKDAGESAADVAKRYLPSLERTLERLLAEGYSETSPQVQWNRKQIARFKAALH